MAKNTAILFDFDGTLCNSETPAMEVAYIELAPYLLEQPPTEDVMKEFCRINGGRAFEFMLEDTDKAREAKGLATIEVVRKARDEDAKVMVIVEPWRERLGLETVAAMRLAGTEPETLLTQQKDDTLIALKALATPVTNGVAMLDTLVAAGYPFCIATTSGKPRVPICVDAPNCNLRRFFPTDAKIHSGESDFDPPRFKPAPDVYLRAADAEGRAPEVCVAVEDSGSGAGSAANANIGLIVGYVGADHISEAMRDEHAKMLLAGKKAESGRGCGIVLLDIMDLPGLVDAFEEWLAAGGNKGGALFDAKTAVTVVKGKYW
eukprot:CAMPEP_0174904740 /NCGR_PEP_ID=MMETSP0167-20121228/50021_1 /TAXON_ID=38298 /ORGANISM="Rhodella maculata, Strain CCMP736" /LENGTH=318 /DNA_ID=CAMNT_0016147475 /DNA_START=14 /DNA_END=967 /DNA_ORIENTATION=-